MRRVSLLMLLAIFAMALQARTGLNVDKIFDGGYEKDSKVEIMMMSGNMPLNGVTLMQLFKGPAKKYASKITPLLKIDGADAIEQKVTYDGGKLHYAFYTLPPKVVKGRKVNRYLCYLDGPKQALSSVMLLYMEGELSAWAANRLFKSM